MKRKNNFQFVLIAVISGILVGWWVRHYLAQRAETLAAKPPRPTPEGKSDKVLVLDPGIQAAVSASALVQGQPDVEPAEPEDELPVRPEDLKKIEGIGPKIASVLQAAGILTYIQLAAAEPEHLAQILKEANIRLANPATWPEQACLAAAGDWDGLAALQDELKGGRRTNKSNS